MGDSIIVIRQEDKPKFFDALKVVETPRQLVGKIVIGAIIALVVGTLLWLFSNVGGLIIVFVGIIVYTVLLKRGAGRSVDITTATPLGRLAKTVADFVFVPLIGMALCDKAIESDEADYIRKKMRAWGYSEEFINEFIEEQSKKSLDSIRLSIADRNIRLESQSRQKKIFRGDLKTKDLGFKAYDLCKKMYDETNNGVTDKVHDSYLSELKARLGV